MHGNQGCPSINMFSQGICVCMFLWDAGWLAGWFSMVRRVKHTHVVNAAAPLVFKTDTMYSNSKSLWNPPIMVQSQAYSHNIIIKNTTPFSLLVLKALKLPRWLSPVCGA